MDRRWGSSVAKKGSPVPYGKVLVNTIINGWDVVTSHPFMWISRSGELDMARGSGEFDMTRGMVNLTVYRILTNSMSFSARALKEALVFTTSISLAQAALSPFRAAITARM